MGNNPSSPHLFFVIFLLIMATLLPFVRGCGRVDENIDTPNQSQAMNDQNEDSITKKTFTGVSKEKIEPNSPLGIGFLWTENNKEAAKMLSSEGDFVDLIMGGGRLDVFDHIKPPVRVSCISLALEKNEARPFPGIRETIEILKKAGISPERVIIAYNPERQPGTPGLELDELRDSVLNARELANAFGSPLLVGPGLREMEKQERLYPELAKLCDIWLIQSQRLQMEPATGRIFSPEEYRREVVKIAESLRSGNPDIKIYVQLVTGGRIEKEIFSPKEVAAYANSVEDIVDAVRIYGGSGEAVCEIITLLRGTGDIQSEVDER